jgi:hypothetical protein
MAMMKYTLCDEQYTMIFSEIVNVLSDTYDEDGVVIWLNSRNQLLSGERPIDLINRGEGLRVREIAYSLEQGGGA